jgi:hypothetical protein
MRQAESSGGPSTIIGAMIVPESSLSVSEPKNSTYAARRIIKYLSRAGAMSGRTASEKERCCAYCQRRFVPAACGKAGAAQKHCSRQCAKAAVKRLVQKICECCGQRFQFRSSGRRNNDKRRFCANPCAARWRMAQPGRTEKSVGPMHSAIRQKWREDTEFRERLTRVFSERMLARNPMMIPGVREKLSVALSGRTFLARGGNGKLTKPQLALHALTALPMEYAIPTKPVLGKFSSLPKSYKVDLADPERKLAVEVDGNSHRTRKWKFLDKRKTSVLNALGWSVLRLLNEEVMANPEAAAQKIVLFTISA